MCQLPLRRRRQVKRGALCARMTLLALSLGVLWHPGRTVALEPHARRTHPAELFATGEALGSVRDGPLIGQGVERIERLPDGGLRVLRIRTYTEVEDSESKRRVRLPEPWQGRASFELSGNLRLRRSEMRLAFHRSIDRALGRPASKRDYAWLFEWDRMLCFANTAGDQLHLVTSLGGREVARAGYEYPEGSIPIELASLLVSVRLHERRERFDFDVLVPGGDSHGVEAEVHRTRDPSRFGREYPVPFASLQRWGELFVVDMRLSSPFKRLIFPHHFYFAYLTQDPTYLVGAWGGEPEQPMLAMRTK